MFEQIIEQKILEAQRRGEFDNLPGMGQPLHFEDESDVPEESRMAYRILKNSGHVPEEMQLRKDINALQQLLEDLPESETDRRSRLMIQINENWTRYHAVMEKRRRG